jgi:hypothetical protein
VIQLIVMDEVPLGPVHQSLGLGSIMRYRFEPEVLGDRCSLVWVRVGWLGDRSYLRSGLSGLTSWSELGSQFIIQSWFRVPCAGARLSSLSQMDGLMMSHTNMPDGGCSRLDPSWARALATSLLRLRIC